MTLLWHCGGRRGALSQFFWIPACAGMTRLFTFGCAGMTGKRRRDAMVGVGAGAFSLFFWIPACAGMTGFFASVWEWASSTVDDCGASPWIPACAGMTGFLAFACVWALSRIEDRKG